MKKNNKFLYFFKNNIVSQKGMALLTTLIFVFLLVTFGVSLLVMTSNDIKMSTLQRDSTKAFYIAEAGIEETLGYLNTLLPVLIPVLPLDSLLEPVLPVLQGEGPLWTPIDFEGGHYEVTVEEEEEALVLPTLLLPGTGKIKITSTGVVEGGTFSSGRRTIEVEAEAEFLLLVFERWKIISWKEVY